MSKYNGILEYNGWISINMHSDDNLEVIDGSDLDQFFAEIKTVIVEFNRYDSRFIEHRGLNYRSNVYFIAGMHNHALSYLDDLMLLCKTIAAKAPGSFGLLYVRLPEDSIDWNRYKVFRMARGKITEHEDTLLSPCQPIIEDN